MKNDPRDDPKSIGRILIDRYIVTPWQLAEALAELHADKSKPPKRLGDMVVKLGHASREDVERAFERQRFMRAKNVDAKLDTAYNVIGMAEAQNARAANSIANAHDRASAAMRRLGNVRRKTGGA